MTRQSPDPKSLDPINISDISPVIREMISESMLFLSNYYYPKSTVGAPLISELSAWPAKQGLLPSALSARPSYPAIHVTLNTRRADTITKTSKAYECATLRRYGQS